MAEQIDVTDPGSVFGRMKELAIARPCPFCNVAAGERCRAGSGEVSAATHARRERDLWEAYRLGFRRASAIEKEARRAE